MLHVTTHVKTDPDQDLLGEKGGNGFPYLCILDSEGRVLAQHEGARTAEGFGETMKTAQEFADLRKKAEGGDAAAQAEVFDKDLELNNLKAADAKAAIAKMKDLSDEKKKAYESKIVGLEVQDIMMEFNKAAQDIAQGDKAAGKKVQAAAGRKFIEMKKAGHVPEDEQHMQPFWIFIMEAAEEAKDAALYEEALKPLKEKFGANPQAKKFFEERDATLAKLKEGGDKK